MLSPMHRSPISDDVLFKLRSLSQRGGQSEDQILRRLLNVETAAPPAPEGFIDATYGVIFAERFEIFRTYKGHAFTARVVQGRWHLDGGGNYDSLNQLSQAVIDGNENAWMFWFFKVPGGGMDLIANLRDPDMVQKRPRKRRAANKPSAAMPATPAAKRVITQASPPPLHHPPPAMPSAQRGKPWEPPT
jgi:hypothetical protein